MKKRMKRVLLGCMSVLFILIIIFQFMRADIGRTIFALKSKPDEKIAVMTNEKNVGDAGEQLMVSIVADEQDKQEDIVLRNAVQAFHYAKIPFEFKHPKELPSISPSPYHVIMITNEKEVPYDVVRSFVEQGGRLYVAGRFFNPQWNELVGIQDNNGFFSENMYGFRLEKPLFPGYESIVEDNGALPSHMLDVFLREQAKVYMTSENVPMLWTYTYGKGKVVYWNTTLLSAKLARGLLVQGLGLAVPHFVSAQAAMKVMFIDDFPAPIPAGGNQAIERDYGVSIRDFYRDIWWEDMKRLAGKHGLRYTNVFIGTYENTMRLDEEELIKYGREQMIYFGRQSIRRGDEIGFHGYNHQSLVTRDEPLDPELGYVPWESQQQMEQSLRLARSLFSYYFPKQRVHTYVPPSNILNKTGMRALVNGFPDLRVIASVYEGDAAKGAFVQEFGLDAAYPSIFHLPRISSGYNQTPIDDLAVTDAIANFGVFNHFIHPDDILDEYRSGGKGWESMRKGLDGLLARVGSSYPHLKSYTAAGAREKLLKYGQAKLDVYYKENKITISGQKLVNPADVIVRVEERKKLDTGSFNGYRVRKLSKHIPVYAVTFTKPFLTIEVKDAMKH
ncbi:MAG: DUF2194 domain-containing protein [Ectobacillus sp.]